MIGRLSIALLMVPWAAAFGQTQQPTSIPIVKPPSGAIVSAPVGTAALHGLLELSLPQGSTVYVQKDDLDALSMGPPYPGSLFKREIRNGRPALVETRFERSNEKNQFGQIFLAPLRFP